MSFIFGNVNSPQQKVATPPVVAQTAPPTTGPQAQQYSIGQIWIDTVSNVVYVLTSFTGGTAEWINTVPASSGSFTSLDVSPGPSSFDGQFRVEGNIDEFAVIRLREDGGTSGTIVIDSLQGTSDTAIEINAAAGGVTVKANGAGNNAKLESMAGPVFIGGTVNASPCIRILSQGGVSNTLQLENLNGTAGAGTIAAASVSIISDAGGVGISAGKDLNFHSTTNTLISSNTSMLLSPSTTFGVLAGTGIDETTSSGDITFTSTVGNIIETAALDIRLDPAATLTLAPTSTVTRIDIGDISPTVNRTTSINAGAVTTAVTDTLNLAVSGVNTNAGASKVVNLMTGTNLLGTQTLNIANGTAASGTKTVNIGNADGLTNINELGVVRINTSGPGATTIGNSSTGGLIDILSATEVRIEPLTTMTIADTSAVTTIDIGNITPTVNRTTTINGGAVVDAHTDTVSIAPGGVNTSASASKVVNVASGATATGSQVVNILSGTNASGTATVNISSGTGGGTKRVNIGNADGLTSISLANSPIVVTSQTIASPTVSVTNSVRQGAILMTGFTTAGSGGTVTVTLTNTFITDTSVLLANVVDLSSNTTAVSVYSIKPAVPGPGSAAITLINNGAQAVNGNLQINFWVLS